MKMSRWVTSTVRYVPLIKHGVHASGINVLTNHGAGTPRVGSPMDDAPF